MDNDNHENPNTIRKEFIIMLDNLNEFLTVNNACDELNVSKQFIYNNISSGELKAHKIGKKIIRIHRKDFIDFINRHLK